MKYEDFSAAAAGAAAAGAVAVPKAGQSGWYARAGKRIFDVTLGLIVLPLLTPVIVVLWLIARMDGGPGFYGHERIGQFGVTFRCWKIRSMVCDANERLHALLDSDPKARAEWEHDQKLTNDPRVTRFGAFVRRTSLDELPQIFNVMCGDMSFVGPRPIVDEELARYGAREQAYLQSKPGITGIWQLSGRNEVSYSERVEFDAEYAEKVSLGLDVALVLRTPASVLLATGK